MSDTLPLIHLDQKLKPLTIALERAGVYDMLLIGALAKRIWQAHYPAIIPQAQIDYMLELMYSPEALYGQMMEESHEFWLVKADAMPVGYMSVSQEGQGHWHIHKIYVDTEMQGIGIGSAMLRHINGLYAPERLTVGVNRDNINAINFYTRHGFTIEATKDTDIGGGFVMEDYVMAQRKE